MATRVGRATSLALFFMNQIEDTQTAVELYLSLDRREDLVAAIDHYGYSIGIERPEATDLYECVTTEENDRYSLLSFTLNALLNYGEYKFTVYSMSAAGTASGNRNAAIKIGTLRVTKTTANFTESTVTDNYVEP